MDGFRQPPKAKNSRREWQRRALTAADSAKQISDKYDDVARHYDECIRDINAVLDICEKRIAWPFISRKVVAMLKKYR